MAFAATIALAVLIGGGRLVVSALPCSVDCRCRSRGRPLDVGQPGPAGQPGGAVEGEKQRPQGDGRAR